MANIAGSKQYHSRRSTTRRLHGTKIYWGAMCTYILDKSRTRGYLELRDTLGEAPQSLKTAPKTGIS